jgi:N4-gp56 family major capsid protein
MAVTKKADLFIPEVVAGKIATDYAKFITVSNFADVETALVGNPGDTVKRFQYAYIGDAAVLAEGADDTPVKLTSAPVYKTIVKVSKQVMLTDEAILSGAGDPYGEAATQIAMSIALKDDADAVAELLTATQTGTGASLAAAIVAGRKALGERGMKKVNYLFANTSDYYDMIADNANWVPASEIAADLVLRGVVGQYMGVNIIPTDTVTAKAPVLMLEGALKKEMKRDFLAERDRDLTAYQWLLAGSEHRVYWLLAPSDVVKLTVGA